MLKKFLFDLDGTVTEVELLPLIARELGIEKEMEILTRRTMLGRIPFEVSFRNRVKMLSSVPISKVQQIVSTVELNEDIVQFIHLNKDDCAIVTGNLDVWLEPLKQKLPIIFHSSRVRHAADSIRGIEHILDKGKIARTYLSKHRSIAIGDGNNDLHMLKNSTIAIAYGGVHKPADSLLKVADYAVYSSRTLCNLLTQLS